ncbi:hypothetical protein [Solitalea lacus]|uniref:hypothetical protein n=1 Tax=Solitalea lacus TaxID=2911172 RepID=UPI001EDAEC44|nr:hypothetical protein [Solitalea lacus]UKJ08821.1 hypothetical protein L2B55_06545 [Solitalea lacus]
MMGNLLAILLWILMAFLPAEKYYVTFIKGTVLLERTKKQVKIGDALEPEDKLVFSDKNAKISCISPSKGRFDISALSAKAGSKGELLAVLRSSLIPATGTYHLSTRSLSDQNVDPEAYFKTGTDDRFLIVENEWIPVNDIYSTKGGNFFFLQYTINGKTVLKKLPKQENAIAFNKSLFVDESGGILNSDNYVNTMLCFQESTNGVPKSKTVAKFIPVIVDKAEILAELAVLRNNLQNLYPNNEKAVKTELYAHLAANYGTINQNLFEDLMHSK